VELRSARSLAPVLRSARAHGVPTILSFHDLKTTPPAARLDEIVFSAQSLGAALIKVATRTDTPAQLDRLFDFFERHRLTANIVPMGIGNSAALPASSSQGGAVSPTRISARRRRRSAFDPRFAPGARINAWSLRTTPTPYLNIIALFLRHGSIHHAARRVPVMPLPGALLFPHALLPLHIFEPRYQEMLDHALREQRMFFWSRSSSRNATSGNQPMTFSLLPGVGLIRACVGRGDGTSNLILQGLSRARFTGFEQSAPFPIARIESLESESSNSVETDALAPK